MEVQLFIFHLVNAKKTAVDQVFKTNIWKGASCGLKTALSK